MSQTTPAYNPFMLMIEPEVVLAAIEKSERLSQLNRHMCRPLDRPVLNPAVKADDESEVSEISDEPIAADSI